MDVQTGLVYVGVVVISAAVILLVSMFGIKEKSYEEAIAEQRKLPHDLLLSKKDKGKEKKHKNKAGKKVKEKKEEKDEKDDKEEKPEHVQFEENPQILPVEPLLRESSKANKKKGKLEKVKPILVNKDEPLVIVTELSPSQPPATEANHFDLIHPKDDLELIRSHSKENLNQLSQNEPVVNKSPKDTPTKSKKNAKDSVKKKDEGTKDEKKEEKKDIVVNASAAIVKDSSKNVKEIKEPKESKDTPDAKDVKEAKDGKVEKDNKDVKDQQKETPVKEVKEIAKENVPTTQMPNKESKKAKKKNDIFAQIGGEKDAVNMSLLMLFIEKAELSRSEIQILIDQLLNKQLDNPSEHSEWSEGRADPVIKLKKQLAEKEKALADEHEASVAFQNKLKELRAELNSERSRLTASARQLEEALNAKATEAQTLHTRMQHILESHAAEKQGFARQIEQLQNKVNEDAAIIHKMQEDQGQTQGHLQQELTAQRKQMEVQFAQMRENENALKTQLAQKHVETQELESQLQATCDSSTSEIGLLGQQIGIMQEELMHSNGQLQHLKEIEERLQEAVRQLDESHCTNAELEHRLMTVHHHEQELQKQVSIMQNELSVIKTDANEVSVLKAELNMAQNELVKLKSELSASLNKLNVAETEASLASALKAELNGTQAELMKLKSELSASMSEAKSEAAEITSLKSNLAIKEEAFNKICRELNVVRGDLNQSVTNVTHLESKLNATEAALNTTKADLGKATANLKEAQNEFNVHETEVQKLKDEVKRLQAELENGQAQLVSATEQVQEMKVMKVQLDRLESSERKSGDVQLQLTRLQEENDRLRTQVIGGLEKDIKRLQEENELLASQLAATTERPAVEGRENGIDEKTQKENTKLEEHANSLAEQVTTLKNDLINKEAQLSEVTAQVVTLRRDVSNQQTLAKRLQDDLETQKTKNNDLRVKNWKVMEALSAAESRVKSNSGNNMHETAQKVKEEHEELTKAFLQRVFPEIKVSEKAHEQWLRAFEEKIRATLAELKSTDIVNSESDLVKQNKKLQTKVLHYQKIVKDTESMLNILQNRVESEETRWVTLLQQKETEILNLRIEISDLTKKLEEMDKLQLPQKVHDLETRLAEAETLSKQVNGELLQFKSSATKAPTSGAHGNDLVALEKLQEEKARLLEELETECSKRATLDAEVLKLRSRVETSESSLTQEKCLVSQLQQEVSQLKNEICGGCSSSEQSMLNGPPASESPMSEPPLTAETLIAELESTLLKNTEFANCSIAKPMNLVQSEQEIDHSPIATNYSSKSCHMTDHNTQASWNPLNGQQHKKHKKKRKSTKKPMAKRRRIAGWFRKKITSKNKLR